MKFLYRLGIWWNLLPSDSVSRWEGATACSCVGPFPFPSTGFGLGEGDWPLCFHSMKPDVISLHYLEAFPHPPVLPVGARLLNQDEFHWKCQKVQFHFQGFLMIPPFSCTVGQERVKAGGKVIYEGQLEFKRFKYTSSVPASFGSSHLSVPTEKLDTEFLQVLL